MLPQIQEYDLDVRFKRGKELILADALSRAYIYDKNNGIYGNDISAHVCLIVSEINITKNKWKEFQNYTSNDEELKILKKIILEGWPNSSNKIPNLGKNMLNTNLN